jgi:putative SOS response-associated peptidase YedK
MCFYYAIVKKNPKALIKSGVVNAKQLSMFDDHFLINGFEHPTMPVITDTNPQEINFFRWGFIPKTVTTEAEAANFLNSYNTLNANSNKIFESKIYSEPVLKQRCLVLCSGFFEWRKVKGKKVPYYISLKDDSVFAFAGVWSKWTDEAGRQNFTYSILTIDANELMAQVHNSKKRMPLILTPENAKRWIDPNLCKKEVEELFTPIPSDSLKAYTIKQFLPLAKEKPNSEIIAYYHYPGLSEIVTEKASKKPPEESEQLRLEL